jgi:hypothetical protein
MAPSLDAADTTPAFSTIDKKPNTGQRDSLKDGTRKRELQEMEAGKLD